MKRIFVLLLLPVILFLGACKEKKGTQISGNISDAQNLTIYLDRVELQKSTPLSKLESDAAGSFSFDFPEGLEPGLYRLRSGAQAAHFIILGGEKDIHINGTVDGIGKDDYMVSGSEATKNYVEVMQKFRSGEMSFTNISN